ncbi:MAG: hypothetical protein ACI94Y_002651 [Maribacter sp.]|jgi:hypothetical protein
MAELINAYDSYNDFERYSYFTVCYDMLPSNLLLDTPLEVNKENMEAVIEAIDFDEIEMEVIFKNWNTEDAKNADFSKDFPYRYLFKSRSRKIIIWITLENEELTVDFLYDVVDEALEKWVISTNHHVRTQFGIDRSPVFKVLSRNNHCFFTEDVRTDSFELDVDKMYNDDFKEVNEIIVDSLSTNTAGLILLYGTPGAGKTSYIKNLITTHQKNKFIFIQNEFIKELLHPDFISFLLKNRNSILVIEDAEKVITTREYSNENSVVSTILQLTDGLFSDYLNIKIICTFNTNIEKIDKALLRKGRMIAYYEFKPLDSKKVNAIMSELGHESNEEEMTLANIFNFNKKGFEKEEKGKKIGF